MPSARKPWTRRSPSTPAAMRGWPVSAPAPALMSAGPTRRCGWPGTRAGGMWTLSWGVDAATACAAVAAGGVSGRGGAGVSVSIVQSDAIEFLREH